MLAMLTGASAPATRVPTVRHTGVITGHVLTLDGWPVRGATVSLIGPYGEPSLSHQPGKSPVVTVRTNSLGQFRAENIPRGTWLLQCEAEGFFRLYEQEPDRVQDFKNKEVTVIVGTDSSTGTDKGISSPSAVTLVMRRLAVLRGRVLDSDGQPITNQRVWLIEPQSGHWGPVYFPMAVDAQGYFIKEYRLYPNLDSHKFPRFPVEERDTENRIVYDAKKITEHLGVSVPGRPGYGPHQTFVLQSGKQTYQEFQVMRGASVSGTVYASDGKTPVAGAEVRLDHWNCPFEFKESGSDSSSPEVTWERNVKTDAQGHYTKTVDPGVATELTAVMLSTDLHSIKAHKVRLGDGEHRKGYDFILE